MLMHNWTSLDNINSRSFVSVYISSAQLNSRNKIDTDIKKTSWERDKYRHMGARASRQTDKR